MRKLFIANKNYSSWSLRPWVLMREKGIAFEEVMMPFEAENYERFRAFSPSARVPTLVEENGPTVWDSLAIAEYLAESHPGIWPTDPEARAFARSVSAEMHSSFQALRDICTMNCGLRVKLHEMPPALAKDVARIGEIWSEGLTRFGGPFLAGSAFTAADAFFCPVAFRVQTYSLPLPEAAAHYALRLLALPAMRDWYEAALREPWREPAHEADVLRSGTITADHRKAG